MQLRELVSKHAVVSIHDLIAVTFVSMLNFTVDHHMVVNAFKGVIHPVDL